ncbi:fungal-specific transcription factor domain-containing protein, partial [Infundibulicybe gibba]
HHHHPGNMARRRPTPSRSPSPELLPVSEPQLNQFHFTFQSQTASASNTSHGSLPSSRDASNPPTSTILPQPALYRFGAVTNRSAYNPMPVNPWPSSTNSSQHSYSRSVPVSHPDMSYGDEYDDVSELVDLPADTPKACDQCRKAKCKCERSAPGDRCKNCVMLNTPCTFLGPSRKRGPPKGYIDAIEARLHQTEALIGVLLSADDDRAQSILRDLSKDPLAKEIINRVDKTQYGVKGRKRDDDVDGGGKPRNGYKPTESDASLPTSPHGFQKPISESSAIDLSSTHPSSEWQDRVAALLTNSSRASHHDSLESSSDDLSRSHHQSGGRPSLRLNPSASSGHLGDDQHTSRRQRRRLEPDENNSHEYGYPNLTPISAAPTHQENSSPRQRGQLYSSRSRESLVRRDNRRSASPVDSSSDSEEELTGAVGQLSLNEDAEVRYHGKASGLYLLGIKERLDGRNEGGIWRFPKARVWPPLPSGAATNEEDEFVSRLPPPELQDHLLNLYFTYVHPSFPIIHKRSFFETFRLVPKAPFNRRRRRVPTLLLLAMYALAARYADNTSNPPPTDGSMMWEAGDDYLNSAKNILDITYASSRPSTCQALLLMGYREVGIGAMAGAWTYVGMAIRMAQDLGMHRSADGWARAGLGGPLFGEWELIERKRIWYGCVIMDKYVSTYIGRPLMVFERDFDTSLPSENDPEELEPCAPQSLDHESMLTHPIPSPQVLTLHMQYWCAVLLLHRPFIRNLHRPKAKSTPDDADEGEARAIAEKTYDLCAGAANHITSIAALYMEHYPIGRCAVFLCYYIFTASIMHVTTLNAHPTDPQTRLGLTKCMEALRLMTVVWPSAGRARELLRGSKVNIDEPELATLANHPDRNKRSADQSLDDSFERTNQVQQSGVNDEPITLRPQSYRDPIYATDQEYYTPPQNVEAQPATNTMAHTPAPYFFSYDRWPSDPNTLAYTGAMSTSVLPQLYSTGLTDDAGVFPGHVPTHGDQNGASRAVRYPQYWNDFATFPQLGAAYGGLTDPSTVIPHQQYPITSQIYIPEHDHVYNHHPIPGR